MISFFMRNKNLRNIISFFFFFSKLLLWSSWTFTGMQEFNENMSPAGKMVGSDQRDHQTDTDHHQEGSNNSNINNSKFPMGSSPYTCQKKVDVAEGEIGQTKQQMPPASVMTRLILIMVWRKLIRNPNTYSSLFGLAWSLISFK